MNIIRSNFAFKIYFTKWSSEDFLHFHIYIFYLNHSDERFNMYFFILFFFLTLKMQLGMSVLAPHSQLQLGKRTSHIKMLVQVLASLLTIQIPSALSQKAGNGSPNVWIPANWFLLKRTREAQIEHLAHIQLLPAFGP